LVLRIVIKAEGKGQRAKGRRQRAEGKGQKAKGRGQRAEGKGQKVEGKRQRAGGRCFSRSICLSSPGYSYVLALPLLIKPFMSLGFYK
jgi:hypothetical protein